MPTIDSTTDLDGRMADFAGQAAPATDRLRDDVRLLGALVGTILREQGGEALFSAVEYMRTTAINMRSSEQASPQEEHALLDWVQHQSTARLQQLVRAFSVYFHVINLAEQHHRSRTLLEREQVERPLRESIAAGIETLHNEGVEAQTLLSTLRQLDVHPVFTAHPSEARRRTLLQHLEHAATLIARLDGLPPGPTREAALDELRNRVTLIWQTAETRADRPTVLDEVRNVLYFMTGNVYDVVPTVQRFIEHAVETSYGESVAKPGDLPPVLRFGTWVGGDRDGNLAVTPDVTRAAARMSRSAVLQRYRSEVRGLGRDFSISARLVGCSADLMSSIEKDLEEMGLQPVRRWSDEPYRRKFGLIAERLRRTDLVERGGYLSSIELLADLDLVRASMEMYGGHRIACGPLLDLIRRVQVFGFYLAELEIRQHADRHTEAIAEMLGLVGVPGFGALDYEAETRNARRDAGGSALIIASSGPICAHTRSARHVQGDARHPADGRSTSVSDLYCVYGACRQRCPVCALPGPRGRTIPVGRRGVPRRSKAGRRAPLRADT